METAAQLENNQTDFNKPRQWLFNVKFLIILSLTLKYPFHEIENPHGRLEKYLEIDLNVCPQCFTPKTKLCSYYNENFQFVLTDFIDILNLVIGTKRIHIGTLKGCDKKIVAKHPENMDLYTEVHSVDDGKLKSDELRKTFLARSEVEGFHFCPQLNLEIFMDRLSKFTSSRIETWMHVIVNAETLLLAVLNDYTNLPVPRYYGHCGFTHYQSYNGRTLSAWNRENLSYLKRLEIALKLLEGASLLSDGFDSYRLYFTDLTYDNIVYDENSDKVTFIDLDSIILVDGNLNRTGAMKEVWSDSWQHVHRHEEIECVGCFAYSLKDICNHYLSDINIFSVCQLLNEDLYGNQNGGFLKPIPSEIRQRFPMLGDKLNECVRCPFRSCQNRFNVKDELIQILLAIIQSCL